MTGPTGEPEQYPLTHWQNRLVQGESSAYPIRRFCMAAVATLLRDCGIVTDSWAHCFKDSFSGWGGCHSEVNVRENAVHVEPSRPTARPTRHELCLSARNGRLNQRDLVITARRLAELGIAVQLPETPVTVYDPPITEPQAVTSDETWPTPENSPSNPCLVLRSLESLQPNCRYICAALAISRTNYELCGHEADIVEDEVFGKMLMEDPQSPICAGELGIQAGYIRGI